MNYFELYEIPFSLSPDKELVKRKFYELSRKYHPDFYMNADTEEQAEALQRSADVNKAFKVFSNRDETIKYLLQQKNLLEEEEKYQLSPDFLMEMMELNEQLMDAKMENDETAFENIKQQIGNIEAGIYQPVSKIIEQYKEGITSEEELLQVKDYYYKKKYLRRILEGMH